MTAKQVSGTLAPDGSTYITLTDGNGNLVSTGGSGVAQTVAPTAWTPTDQSGAGLTFTGVSAMYQQIGNIVYAYGTLTYPTTSNSSNAIISLPVAVPNQNYAAVNSNTLSFAGLLKTIPNTLTAAVFTSSGGAEPNSAMSGKTINFLLIYPAS